MKNPKTGKQPYDFDFLESASTMECTGLIPSSPENEEEMESYFDIMKFSPEDINIYNK